MADVQNGLLTIDTPEIAKVPALNDGASNLLNHLLRGDEAAAQTDYETTARELPLTDLLFQVIEPGLTDIGERWFRGTCTVYQEHVASQFFRRKLMVLIDQARTANTQPRHSILIGTVQGDRHEGGVLILTLLLEQAGWRTLSVGVDLSIEQYIDAIEQWRPDALALSFVLSRNINKRFQELARIVHLPVFVGGRSILNYQKLARQHNLIPVPGPAPLALDLLQKEFEEWRARHASE